MAGVPEDFFMSNRPLVITVCLFFNNNSNNKSSWDEDPVANHVAVWQDGHVGALKSWQGFPSLCYRFRQRKFPSSLNSNFMIK